jgi:hypothetical protein
VREPAVMKCGNDWSISIDEGLALSVGPWC